MKRLVWSFFALNGHRSQVEAVIVSAHHDLGVHAVETSMKGLLLQLNWLRVEDRLLIERVEVVEKAVAGLGSLDFLGLPKSLGFAPVCEARAFRQLRLTICPLAELGIAQFSVRRNDYLANELRRCVIRAFDLIVALVVLNLLGNLRLFRHGKAAGDVDVEEASAR